MRKLYYCTTLLTALLLLLGQRPARAQQGRAAQPNAAHAPHGEGFTCYPVSDRARAGQAKGGTAGRPNAQYNPNGYMVTARGELHILVVYAGFTNDVNVNAPDYYDSPTNPWPQTDAAHPVPGTSFPKNYTTNFYSSPASFSPTATDKSLSNFYYQMSRFGGNPLKMVAHFFPKRINVTATQSFNSVTQQWETNKDFSGYTYDVFTALQSDPDTHNFDFSQVDRRGGAPYFQSDNSAYAPDHEVDYVVLIWRNSGVPYGLNAAPGGGAGGWAAVGYAYNIPSANNQLYNINGLGFTHTAGMGGISTGLFKHEFAHTFYNSPHYFGANAVVGKYFYATEGPGMMSYFATHNVANAWERWFNGWAELGASGIGTDIQNAASLSPTNGIYTLRDFVTTGDMMRIRIPGSSQYLWLENHQHKSVFDARDEWLNDGQGQPFRAAPTGIVAMVEDMSGDRNVTLDPFGVQGVNGLKTLSAQGNFDYTFSSTTSDYNWHLYGNQLNNLTNPVPNPFGGHNQITRLRMDRNNNGTIDVNPTHGNCWGGCGTPNEQIFSVIKNGNYEDGFLGPDVAFNTVGQKLGIAYNTPVFEHQAYDQTARKLAPIRLNGLSVELVGKNSNGDITVRVRYDDTDLNTDTRWTGELLVSDVPGAANGYDVNVKQAHSLLINKSGTPNRHTRTASGDFINPTSVVCQPGSSFHQEYYSTVTVTGAGTVFRVGNDAQVILDYASTFVVNNGARLEIEDNALFQLNYGAKLRVENGGTVVIRNATWNRGLVNNYASSIEVVGTGKVIVEQGAFLQLNNPASTPGLTLQDAASELRVKGRLETASNVHLTFNGTGLIAFDGPGASTLLGYGSRVVQSGTGTSDVLYSFENGASVALVAYSVELTDGLLKYGPGSSLNVRNQDLNASYSTQYYKNLNFTGDGDGMGLFSEFSTTLQLISCQFENFERGLMIDHTPGQAFLENCQVRNCGLEGIRLGDGGGTYVSNSLVRECPVGIFMGRSPLYLRNRTIVSDNNVGVAGYFDSTTPGRLIVGDQGCGWIINNGQSAVMGTDILLDIDGAAHRGRTCDPHTNRFDGNGGLIFDICYSTPVPAANLNATESYWGGGQPAPGDYRLAYSCENRVPTVYTLNTNNFSSCEPLRCGDSCALIICSIVPDEPRADLPRSTAGKLGGLELRVYPNPAKNTLRMQLANATDEGYTYQLLNAFGQVIETGAYRGGEQTLSLERLPAGSYVLRLLSKSGKQQVSQRFVHE